MDYKIKNLPKSEVEITVTVPEDKLPKYMAKAAEEISKDVKVKGFRPGHVPADVLEGHVDKKLIEARAQELAIQDTYVEIVIKEKIQVVSRPKVKIEKESPLVYVVTVAILPEVKVKDHKSIKVPKKEVKVTDKDIEEVLMDLKKRATTYKDVDRAAKKGDRVEVDFEGFDENEKAHENTKSTNHPLILGEQSLIPGFEEELYGLKKGEKKEFHLTFPKDYGKEDFRNKKVKFKAEMKRVEEGMEPILDESFVEKITGQKKSVDDLKKDIELNVKSRKEKESYQEQENKYLEEVLKKTDVEVPHALIDEEVEFMIADIKGEIDQKGMNFEDFLKQAKTSPEELRKKYHPEAEKRVKIRLALQFLIKEEGIEVTDDEANNEFEMLKSYYPPAEHAKIEEQFKSGQLKAQLKNKLALRKLFEKVLGH